jgi:hypothetical protein
MNLNSGMTGAGGYGMEPQARQAFQAPVQPPGGGLPKGNLAKLSYDPFADLNQDIALGMPVGETTPPMGIVTGTPVGMGNMGGGFGMTTQNQGGMMQGNMGNQGFNTMPQQPQYGQGVPIQSSAPIGQAGYATGMAIGQPTYGQQAQLTSANMGGYGLDTNTTGYGGVSAMPMQSGMSYQPQQQGYGQQNAYQDIPSSMFQAPAPVTGQSANLFAGTSMKTTGPQWGQPQQPPQQTGGGGTFGGTVASGPRPGGFGGFKPVQQGSNNSTDLI